MASATRERERNRREKGPLDGIDEKALEAAIEAIQNRPKNPQAALLEESMDALAKLGGQAVTDESVLHYGTRLILPETMTERGAIEFLKEYLEVQESVTKYRRMYRYRPFDVAAALQRALQRVFGSAGVAKGTYTFFGRQPPELVDIQVGVGETLQVPWGSMTVPALDGQLWLGVEMHSEWGQVGSLVVDAPRKFKAHVEGLFAVIEEELRRSSIYKGQAVDGQTVPEFMDLSGVDPEQVIYSEEAIGQLEANIWSVLRHTAKLRELGIPRKRAVLLEGPFGTGKTLAAFLTAQIAVENGWTFIYCRPARDNLFEVMATARLYQPCVVFFEDVDVLAEGASTGEEFDTVTQLLDMFDGITAKGTEILAVLTTNHKERIHRAMIRPGRLDALVHIGALDASGVERMIKAIVRSDLLDPEIDYGEVYEAMEGFLPAFVKEAIDRTMRYAISRSGGNVQVLTTEDFVQAATGLRPQLELMEGAGEGKAKDSLGEALRKNVAQAVDQSPILEGDDHVLTLTTGGNGR